MFTFRMTTCILLVAATACAQDLVPKAAPGKEPVVLTNAVLHTVSDGIILQGTIWFADGVIRGVLPKGYTIDDLPDSPPPRVIDLEGKHVYPGLISAHTTLGLVEIGMVRQTVDSDELGELTPEAIAAVAVNPDTTAIPVARSNGVLAACVFPQRGLVPGRASVIQLDGWTNADLTVRKDAGPVVSWPSMSFGDRPRRRGATQRDEADPKQRAREQRQAIAEAFVQARAWLDAHVADPGIATDIRHLALVPALRGEVPVFVLADDLEQIESAVLWATGAGLHPIIVGGREAEACAPLLRERHVAVIVDGVHKLPRREDSAYDEAFTLPARLARQGIEFCIATGSDFSSDRNLPYHAATAAAFGLTPQQALAAITLDAARILGVGDRLGSLTQGKDATLFVTDGSPLELATRIEMAFIAGRQVDLRNKQTELAAKYRERYRQLRAK
ncbi:MAG: amidohydrolase family protein [Planctomycetes bacterium]|nr:amidohydrolase family protein [Planctomycetota bacterium]